MTAWEFRRAGDLQEQGILLVEDGNHGEYRPRPTEFSQTGVAFIRAADMREGVVNFSNAAKINETAMARIRKGIGHPGDVLLTHKGTVGTVARAPQQCPDFVCSPQTTFWRTTRPSVLDQGFLHATLRSSFFQAQLDRLAHQTDMAPYASLTDQKTLHIPLPPLPEQQAIAEVLGALDDKIAANRALVATSLELVTLHHRQIKASAPMLTMRYTEAAEVGGGATPSTKEPSYWGGSIPWAAPTDITALSAPYLEDTPRKITNAGLAACSSPLYPAGSILMTSRATIGAFAVTQIPTAVNQGFIVVKPQDPALRWWLLAEMQHRVPEYINRANGATFLELPRKAFRDMEFTRPNDAALHRFDQLADPLHQSAIAAQRESAILANLRDTLLPALMDGTIRVKDAIATAEEVL